MTNQEEIIRGADAKQLLENPLFREAVQAVKDGIVGAMQKSALGDESTHHRLVISLQLLQQVVKHLETVVETGEMAQMQVNESLGQRIRRAF